MDEKMKFETQDITKKNIDRIAELFPNAITERRDDNGKLTRGINFEILKQELSSEVVDGSECYDFTWVGKKESIIEANKPIRKTLRPCFEESKDWENTENLYIEGDNLEALKLLQESYLNKVKLIYIDPPYNTGNDFIYNDHFKMNKDEYDEETGVYDEEGNRLFKNTDTNGRFHSDWCSMMYSRLKLSKNLMKDDGVIFISIDDNEVHNLRKLMDQIFGVESFIADIIWEKRFTRNNDAKLVSSVIDHILFYRKSNILDLIREPRTEKANSIYKNPDNDTRGRWTSVSFVSQRTKEQRPNLSYPITNPFREEKIEHPVNAWKYSFEQYQKLSRENRLYWGPKGKNKYPRLKRFLAELNAGIVPINLWKHKETGTIDDGTKLVDEIIGKDVFDYPKPVSLIKRMLQLVKSENDIFLDFFSGSATTAHAVMQLNAEDGGNRKFIMVQLPEPCDENSEAFKAGYKTISDIGKERIRRAGEKIKAENGDELDLANLDIGFRVFKVDSSNMKDVYYGAAEYEQKELDHFVSNIKDDRTDIDLLYGVMLDWGLSLALKHSITHIEGIDVHIVDEDPELGISLIACFEEDVTESVIRAIANKLPLRAVFRDSSFHSSSGKINVTEIFKVLSPNTKVKVI